MLRLSIGRLPIVGLSASLVAVAALSIVAGADSAQANPSSGSVYYGRWTVDDSEARFSTRGREYKTIDIAPCGKDFCGVSVNDAGRCGPVLFRLLSKSRNLDEIRAHGKWGTAKKKVALSNYENATTNKRAVYLTLGDGYEFDERSGNMPTYESSYARTGAARCTAR